LIERRTFRAMDGDCELFGIGVSPAVLADGEAWVKRMDHRFSRFSPWSEISRFNDSAFEPRPVAMPEFGRWVSISSDLELLLREALRAFEKSEGLVHAGVLPALRAAGYTRDFAEGPTPATTAPPALAPLPELLEVGHREARLVKGAAIDLGGIAKGWMADRLVEHFGENVLVNLCGDLFARGGGETGEGWPVGFGDRTILLKDMGAATSGTTKRAWAGGHHLIDPRTRLPAQSDLTEVAVLARTAVDAEIYAKVALLMGSAKAPTWLEGRSMGWSLN
jgi:thiamine biosynthesis lipoprotein